MVANAKATAPASPPLDLTPPDRQLAPRLPATMDATALIAKAIETGTPVETMEKLLAMRAQLRDEDAKAAFFRALSDFQAETFVIKKTKTVQVKSDRGTYSYNFAPLEEIIKAIRDALQRHGLSYRFDSELLGGPQPAQKVTCIITHVCGHAESNTFEAPIDTGAKMNSMQKAASAVTYARRYALCDGLGLVTGDTDDDARGTDAGAAQASAARGAAPRLTQPKSTKEGAATRNEESRGEAGASNSPATLSPTQLRSLWAAVKGAPRFAGASPQEIEASFRTFLGTLGCESTKELTQAEIPPLQAWISGESE